VLARRPMAADRPEDQSRCTGVRVSPEKFFLPETFVEHFEA